MIIVKDITVEFEIGKPVLDKVNYTFNENKVYGIMAASGKGKTTLLRTICGLLKPTSGDVYYNETKIKKPNKNIFMMHQHYTNFPWKTCLENIMFPLTINGRVTDKQIEEGRSILNIVGLGDYEFKFPSELSGGMNQRLALARVVMAKPKVILMDEPMSALDHETRMNMQDLLLNSHKFLKNTIIMVTHDETECKRMSDEIINF